MKCISTLVNVDSLFSALKCWGEDMREADGSEFVDALKMMQTDDQLVSRRNYGTRTFGPSPEPGIAGIAEICEDL